jgi:Mor family transcriptional regulator
VLFRSKIENLVALFVDIASGKYVSGKRVMKERRNIDIERLFNGVNYLELASKFNLSIRQVRRLINKRCFSLLKEHDRDNDAA